VIAGAAHRFLIAEQMREIGVAPTIVLEPQPRNTAAAAAIAALIVARSRPDGLLLLLPTDHVISDAAGFRATVEEARHASRAAT
jgi:mannose-1-phosphate guanylyltransferase